MNREILFRRVYRHRKTGEIRFVEWGVYGDSFRGPASLSEYDVVVDEQLVCKNEIGEKVFEGDCIEAMCHNDPFGPSPIVGVVKFSDVWMSFGIGDGGAWWSLGMLSGIKRINTIHSKLEL